MDVIKVELSNNYRSQGLFLAREIYAKVHLAVAA